MYENLQTQQSRGTLTFDLACDDLQLLRYEAIKTDELLSVVCGSLATSGLSSCGLACIRISTTRVSCYSTYLD
jgi:hypothetical protein